MRKIAASEVKPGMTIQWFDLGIKSTCVVSSIEPSGNRMFQEIMAQGGGEATLDNNAPVTVLSDPAPPQPEEPTEFGAKVRVREGQFVRLDEPGFRFRLWYEMGTGRRLTWDELCEMGPVTVVPDQGWTVPAGTPEVPDRIEEWPEDDTALRKHKWRDRDGDIWSWAEAKAKWKCYDHMGVYRTADHWPSSLYAPFTRVIDA